MMTELHRQGTQTWHLVLAWGFVGIPLAWGVAETITNALKLFQ
jgi:predicted phosphoribosyltransferase